jgi:hypothetical protein
VLLTGSLVEKREYPGTFDRDLTVTRANIREQRETSASGIWLDKAFSEQR